MLGLDPRNGSDIRQAALLLSETFHLPSEDGKSREGPARQSGRKRVPERKSDKAQQNAEQASTCPAIVNAPLDFQLQKLDVEHSYLKERGFTTETILHFGLGYCSRGLLQDRIAISLHDDQGVLIGYAGRLVDDAKITKENPKYRFPGTRERDGKRYEFRKSLFLYNGFAVGSSVSDLVVVEGFPSTWWLWQHGFPNVAALMGDSCSEEQANIIVNRVREDGRVWLMPDADPGGDLCGQSVVKLVAPHRFIRWIRLRAGEQPTGCSGEELSALLHGQHSRKGGPDGCV
jgi:DNA primase